MLEEIIEGILFKKERQERGENRVKKEDKNMKEHSHENVFKNLNKNEMGIFKIREEKYKNEERLREKHLKRTKERH